MSVLAIRKTAWNNLSVRDREIIRAIGSSLNLGTPAEWIQPPNTRWFLFSDTRFSLGEIAYFGCVAANLNDIPAGYQLPVIDILDDQGVKIGEYVDRRQVRQDAKNFCENVASTPVVWPVTIPDGTANVWQYVLDVQGTPAAMQMGDHPPASWHPLEVV
jgi:hypothetical protein